MRELLILSHPLDGPKPHLLVVVGSLSRPIMPRGELPTGTLVKMITPKTAAEVLLVDGDKTETI